MGLRLIDIKFRSNEADYIKYLGQVAESLQLDVDHKIPTIARGAKRTVKNALTEDFGIDSGTYQRSFTINNYSESKWHVGFQVFAKNPHYRLTHLLEGGTSAPMYGHRTVLFRWGKGERTRFGNYGMSHVYETKKHYKGHHHIIGYTNKIEHIEPGQYYAETKVERMYEDAIKKALSKGMIQK